MSDLNKSPQELQTEIEALREKVAELSKVVVHQDECYAGLEKQLASMTQERDEWKSSTINGGNAGYLREQLTAAQARNAVLRETFVQLKRYLSPKHVTEHTVIDEALATPDDSSALDAALKVERMRCADKVLLESGKAAELIRSMK